MEQEKKNKILEEIFFIEQELEKYTKEELINIWKVKQVIQKAREELKKRWDKKYKLDWSDIEDILGK